MNKLFVIIFFSLSISVVSQTNTWDGSTDTDWHKACNWSLNLIPTCSHAVVIPTVGNYPSIAGIAHSNTVSITSAAVSALSLTSSGGGVLYISNGGGSCAGTATDNGGCACGNLALSYFSGGTDGHPPCDASGPCGTFCYTAGDCAICQGGGNIPACIGDPDCITPCGINCGGYYIYQYVP